MRVKTTLTGVKISCDVPWRYIGFMSGMATVDAFKEMTPLPYRQPNR